MVVVCFEILFVFQDIVRLPDPEPVCVPSNADGSDPTPRVWASPIRPVKSAESLLSDGSLADGDITDTDALSGLDHRYPPGGVFSTFVYCLVASLADYRRVCLCACV